MLTLICQTWVYGVRKDAENTWGCTHGWRLHHWVQQRTFSTFKLGKKTEPHVVIRTVLPNSSGLFASFLRGIQEFQTNLINPTNLDLAFLGGFIRILGQIIDVKAWFSLFRGDQLSADRAEHRVAGVSFRRGVVRWPFQEPKLEAPTIPRCSMYYVYFCMLYLPTKLDHVSGVNVGKYSIHGSSDHLAYMRPICKAYVREYTPKTWSRPQFWAKTTSPVNF